jgi:O-antigen ligase
VRNLTIEGGVYLLLLFTPLAFGGVEMWAGGVLQIVTGLVFAVWLWGILGHHDSERTSIWRRYLSLWVPMGLFVLLVLFQLIPLPPAALQSLSPATHHLYENTLPGYAQGDDFHAESLSPWLMDRFEGRIPPGLAGAGALPDIGPAEFDIQSSTRKTLSIYPFLTRMQLTYLLCLAAIFLVITEHFRDRKRLARLLGVAVFSGFVVSFIGIIQKLTWNGNLYWIREGNYINVFGPFVNRNNYAAFAGFLLPLALCLSLRSLRQVRSGEREAIPGFFFNSFSAVVIGGGIFFSLSRGGMLAAGVSTMLVAAFLVYYGRHGIELALLGLLLVFAVGFLVWLGPEAVVERVGTISEAQSTPSLALRVAAWQRSFELIGEHPFLGTGLGTFAFSFMRYAPPGRAWWTTAHNEYIELLADTGLVGGILFIFGIAAYLRLVFKPSLFRQKDSHYAFSGLIAGIAAVLLHSAISSNLQIPANGLMLVVLAGCLLNLVATQGRKSRKPSVSRRRKARSTEAPA